MNPTQRLLKYINFLTPSDENSSTVPSSDCQFALAEALVEEMKQIGIEDAKVDDKCYVYGHIPASEGCENVTPIGFIAHVDTVADFCDRVPNPITHENYDGEAVVLGESGLVLDPKTFPHLENLKGRTLITTDGTTILGADDKAGIAEILTALEEIIAEGTPHGSISVAFTPDEEIGTGAHNFDVTRFNAKYAYTLDGDVEGGIEYETFNAAMAKAKFHGENVHPGSAKGIMINAALVAMEFNELLPTAERPEYTENYEGFNHLIQISGSVGEALTTYIIRDHDAAKFEARQDGMRLAAKHINEKYGEGSVELDIRLQYRNMAEIIKDYPETVEKAKAACAAVGIEPTIKPVRGGTDGSQLSFMGLPCPNLGTGGYAFHGPYEHITVEGMNTAVKIIKALITEYARC
ncbi:MAG: peptidase T [Clostridiales bacterium]|nr:peptidase T [Clostridiales bacterium]